LVIITFALIIFDFMNDFIGNKNFKSIILSAGVSQRMNTHKALLQYSVSENFLQHIISVYRESGVNNITVVANPEIIDTFNSDSFKGISIVANNFPERGRLFSLHLGLKTEPDVDFCFVQNIDDPFVTKEIIETLCKSATKADYITPVYRDKGGHPVLISLKVIRHILTINKFNVTLRDELEKFNRYKIEMNDEKILANINTVEDYKKYFQFD